MGLSNRDIHDLIALRRGLHQHPELSGEEAETAERIVRFLATASPDRMVRNLGGHGLAAIYNGQEPGPSVIIRAELDALPIVELSDATYRSKVDGKGHLCGHDGHMTILTGLARLLARQLPARGRVVVLFQPAEENGKGAAAVIADENFSDIASDYAFSLHNMPGLPLGHISLAPGPSNCASRGMRIVLTGRTAHASQPETGTAPTLALAELLGALTNLGPGGNLDEGFTLTTVTHAALGEAAFGIAPGEGEIWVTLRTLRDDRMADLVARAEALVGEVAGRAGLGHQISYGDVFHHCENDPEATERLRRAAEAEGITLRDSDPPMRGSEDFGLFGHGAKSAMFLLGAGEAHAHLHNPDYDFPDDLIEIGVRVFHRTIRDLLG